MKNPWKLSPTQCKTMQALCAAGSTRMVAQSLGLTERTVETYLSEIKARMGVGNRVLAVLEWDRWQREAT